MVRVRARRRCLLELCGHAQLVEVAVAAEKRDAVGVAPLERDEQLAQAEVARPVIAHVAAVDEVRALVHQLQLFAGAVEAQHARGSLHPPLEVGEIALNVCAVGNFHRVVRHPVPVFDCKATTGAQHDVSAVTADKQLRLPAAGQGRRHRVKTRGR